MRGIYAINEKIKDDFFVDSVARRGGEGCVSQGSAFLYESSGIAEGRDELRCVFAWYSGVSIEKRRPKALLDGRV